MKLAFTYYKLTGKHYSAGESVSTKDIPWHEVLAMVRKMIANHQLPDLQSGNWDGLIRVKVTESGEHYDLTDMDHLFVPVWLEHHIRSMEAYDDMLGQQIGRQLALHEKRKAKTNADTSRRIANTPHFNTDLD